MTEQELMRIYIEQDFDDIMTFHEFVERYNSGRLVIDDNRVDKQ